MNSHSAEEIVDKLPKEFISGDRDTYVKAVNNAKAIFSNDGRINEEDIKIPLAVLRSFNEKVAAAEIDLTKTYTNEFVGKVPNAAAN